MWVRSAGIAEVRNEFTVALCFAGLRRQRVETSELPENACLRLALGPEIT